MFQAVARVPECLSCTGAADFVGFIQKDVKGTFPACSELQHKLVQMGEWVANVHDEYDAAEGFSFEDVGCKFPFPLLLLGLGPFGIAVAWQIAHAKLTFIIKGKKIDKPGFAGATGTVSQSFLMADAVDNG